MLVASTYCTFKKSLEPFLKHKDTVLLLGSILELEVNASAPMWFIKV